MKAASLVAFNGNVVAAASSSSSVASHPTALIGTNASGNLGVFIVAAVLAVAAVARGVTFMLLNSAA